MAVTVKLKYLRIAPRKVRLVADMIRRKKIEEAQNFLNFTTKKAAKPLLKLLKTAVADARHNFQLDPDNLYISKITVDEGPKLKRWKPRSRGMAHEIQKKTSHLTLVLDEITLGKKVRKAKKVRKPAKETPEIKKPKLRPETEAPKPKITRGIKRIFRRKAF